MLKVPSNGFSPMNTHNRFEFMRQEKQESGELLQLRNNLKALQAWPEAGDEFLNLVPEFNRHSPPITDADSEWLPQVVQDSLRGVDIGFQYPAFFQKLLMNPRLRRLFLTELEQAQKPI